MTLEVLVSCMNQKDSSIVQQSGITTDALIINQCNYNDVHEYKNGSQRVRLINTSQKGLSRSRNMAIENAQGEICLLCDDDEMFVENYENLILNAFRELPSADIIAFNIANHPCSLVPRIKRLRRLESLKVSSCQIAFKRDRIYNSSVRFDCFMGAGSGNGGGEEVKFLLDCINSGLNIYYMPVEIAALSQAESTWFFGFNRTFFYQRGIATRYMLGFLLSFLYAFYYILFKRKMYIKEISTRTALFETMRGIINNDIHWQKIERRKDENKE